MNKTQKKQEARRQGAMILAAVPLLRSSLSTRKNRYIAACAKSYARTSHFRDEDFQRHEAEIAQALERHYIKIAKRFHGVVREKFFKCYQHSTEIKQESLFEYKLKIWAKEQAARRAKPIAGTTRRDINRAVQRAFAGELPEAEVIKKILEVRGYSYFRADAVARTETHNAAMYASQETARTFAQEERVGMKKEWIPAEDERSREWHAKMADHPAIGINESFEVPNPKGGYDRMTGPGDTSAPASQVINCRCVLVYEVV